MPSYVKDPDTGERKLVAETKAPDQAALQHQERAKAEKAAASKAQEKSK